MHELLATFQRFNITPAQLVADWRLYALAAVQALLLLYYAASVWQMSSYRLRRVLFHFPRPRWHLRGFVAPFALFMLSCASGQLAATAALVALYAAALAIWARGCDRRLVITARIRRLFATSAVLSAALSAAHFALAIDAHVLDIVALSMAASAALEGWLNRRYVARAAAAVAASSAKIVLITASFGKTSIKHFLADLLGSRAYFAPGSINTLAGLARDINENLAAKRAEIYIAEAGAREPGDIAAIAKLLQPQVVIIGEIGSAHLEYFGDLARTKATKREALQSARLERVFLHSSAAEEGDAERFGAVVYDELVSDVRADLEGVRFCLREPSAAGAAAGASAEPAPSENPLFSQKPAAEPAPETAAAEPTPSENPLFSQEFFAPVLGSFNAQNLAAAMLAAQALGIQPHLQRIKPVAHRLQVLSRTPKFIIDDGFNGNEAGVLASYELAALYPGRKLLATPGLVEVSAEANERVAAAAARVFDLVIVTARINAAAWQSAFERAGAAHKLLQLAQKSELQSVLAAESRAGDLVLFSNDAPNDF